MLFGCILAYLLDFGVVVGFDGFWVWLVECFGIVCILVFWFLRLNCGYCFPCGLV